ncbi:phage tail tape measure protein [Limibacter armeniacum]|uniref:phage tail tape measure protein n=1 Tax=Limibacter armeniacum TaxID=466084 RepID=UPI002FE58FF8
MARDNKRVKVGLVLEGKSEGFKKSIQQAERDMNRFMDGVRDGTVTTNELTKSQRALKTLLRNSKIGSDDYNNAQKALSQVQGKLREENLKLRDSFSAGGKGAGISGALTKASAAGLALVGTYQSLATISDRLVDIYGGYEAEMNKVIAITGATKEETMALEDITQRMGATTVKSAGEATQAVGYLSMAGLNAQQSMKALPSTLQLSLAGFLGLADAANISTNIMKAMGLEVEDLSRINDILAQTSRSANTNVTKLGEGFKNVGPVAKSLNVTTEEVATYLGIMGDKGIEAAEAGTGLKSIMTSLIAPTSKVNAELKSQGIFIDGNTIRQEGLINTLRKLRGVNEKTLIELVGKEQYTKLLAVLDDADTGYEKLFDRIQNSKGVAEQMANIMQKGLKDATLSFNSAIEALWINLGESGLGSALERVVRQTTELVNVMNDALDPISRINRELDELAKKQDLTDVDKQYKQILLQEKLNELIEKRNSLIDKAGLIEQQKEFPQKQIQTNTKALETEEFGLLGSEKESIETIKESEKALAELNYQQQQINEEVAVYEKQITDIQNALLALPEQKTIVVETVTSTSSDATGSSSASGFDYDGDIISDEITPEDGIFDSFLEQLEEVERRQKEVSKQRQELWALDKELHNQFTKEFAANMDQQIAKQLELADIHREESELQFEKKEAMKAYSKAFADSTADNIARMDSFDDALRASANDALSMAKSKALAYIFEKVMEVVPFPYNLIAAPVAVAGGSALFDAVIPKFADGGIVSGRTLAEVGEYAGARYDPEVIAPLSKLQGMLGGGVGEVEFKIRDDELVGFLRNHQISKDL